MTNSKNTKKYMKYNTIENYFS